jgi:hypothetical protein
MKEHILAWSNRDEYMADLHFLDQVIWPEIKDKQIAHDSYCCDRFPGMHHLSNGHVQVEHDAEH